MKIKHILILLFSLFLLSCGGSKDIATAPVEKHTLTIKEVVHDTTFVTVPDTATYKALLDCQNGKVVVKEVLVNSEGKNHLKKPKVKIEDNKLSVDCEARAQELFAKWKSEQKTEVHETVRNIYHEVEKSLTWWQLFQIWCGRLLLIVIMLFLIIKYLVKVYKPI